jgi:hypothetical protein
MKKRKFFQPKIFNKFTWRICLISSETKAKFYLESQSGILDNERKFDLVILRDYTRFFSINQYNLKADYFIKVFSNYVPEESVIHKK